MAKFGLLRPQRLFLSCYEAQRPQIWFGSLIGPQEDSINFSERSKHFLFIQVVSAPNGCQTTVWHSQKCQIRPATLDSCLFTSRQLTNQISGRSAHIWGFGTLQPHSLLIRPTPMAVARPYINLQGWDARGSKAYGLSFNLHGVHVRSDEKWIRGL